MNVVEFMSKKDIDTFSRELLDAFECYVRDENLIKIKEIFGDYFSETDRINSFMTQIELNFFDKMNTQDEILFVKVLEHTIVLYDLNKHRKATLLYLLKFVLYIKLYDISYHLSKIWRELEKIGFEDEPNRVFALKILRYIVAFKNPNSSKVLIESMLTSSTFHLDFAPMILMYKGKKEVESIPGLLSKFSRMDWEREKDKNYFDKLGKTLIREVGLATIVYIIQNANYDSLWFIVYLLETKRIEVSLDKSRNEEMFVFKRHEKTIEVMSKDITRDIETILVDFIISQSQKSKKPKEILYKKKKYGTGISESTKGMITRNQSLKFLDEVA